MNQDYRVNTMVTNDWKLPLNVAIGLHILLLLSSIYLPGIFKARPKFAEITTVKIINIAEPQLAAPAPPPPKVEKVQEVVKKEVKPPQAKKVAPIAAPEPVQPQAPPKAVSLKPLKKKVKKKVEEPKVAQPTPKQKPKQEDKALAQKRRQALAEAIRQEELLAEKARLAREALEMEKSLLNQTRMPVTAPRRSAEQPSTGRSGRTSSDGASSKIADMYYAAIRNKLTELWAVPESIQKKSSLMATAVITIKQNGEIADIFFESQSGDVVFDQSVKQTIRAANPMPPIPAALKRQRIEFGLNFRPSGIQ